MAEQSNPNENSLLPLVHWQETGGFIADFVSRVIFSEARAS